MAVPARLEVDEGLVDAERFRQGDSSPQQGHHDAARLPVGVVAHRALRRAGLRRASCIGISRPHPELARLIAGRRHDTPLAGAADDDGLAPQAGFVALLDGGEEASRSRWRVRRSASRSATFLEDRSAAHGTVHVFVDQGQPQRRGDRNGGRVLGTDAGAQLRLALDELEGADLRPGPSRVSLPPAPRGRSGSRGSRRRPAAPWSAALPTPARTVVQAVQMQPVAQPSGQPVLHVAAM